MVSENLIGPSGQSVSNFKSFVRLTRIRKTLFQVALRPSAALHHHHHQFTSTLLHFLVIAQGRIITREREKNQVTISSGSFIATGTELIHFMFCRI